MTARFESKILSRGDCVAAVAAGRYARPLVFTNGVFDIPHRGHATYLDQAAQLGGTLIVAVNTDESVRRLGKGAERPLNRMEDRAALLAALGCRRGDLVPRGHARGPDRPVEARPDRQGRRLRHGNTARDRAGQELGRRAVAIPFEFERSTTALVKKIQGG